MSDDPTPDVRATRRAQKEAERAARAQRKADAARRRAMEAAHAGGLFEGMENAPDATPGTPAGADTPATADTPAGADTPATAETPIAGEGAPAAGSTTREPLDPALRKKIISALAVASVVLVVVAGLATWGYLDAREDTSVEQTIADAPTAATDAAREIATQMFTYDHRTVDADLGAVRELLTGNALQEFVEQSMPAVSTSAKEHEASVYATVAAAAPEEVTDDEKIAVLVMLNRMVSSRESPEAAASASRLRLHMVEDDGQWKLEQLESL